MFDRLTEQDYTDRRSKHFSNVHKNRFACDECPAHSFALRADLKRHIKAKHSKSKDHHCHCGKSFVRKDHLTRHEKLMHSLGDRSEFSLGDALDNSSRGS